jgi:branched-chain amino acid aminotransferase
MNIRIHDVKSSTRTHITAKHEHLTFGETFTDRMFSAHWTGQKGWHDAEIMPYGPLQLDPAANVLHYAQQAFEGLKAHRWPDGRIAIFRPEQHADRLDRSAERLCMPKVGRELFLEAVETLVDLERDWVPQPERGTLYIRPTIIGTEAALGVRVSRSYIFYVITCPVGAYFPRGFTPVTIYVEPQLVRAAPGGIGFAKSAGNYAASLLAGKQAHAHGCDQVLFLDAHEHRYLEELGGMNVYCVFDGVLTTPPLSGSILPGITRASILELAPTLGHQVAERPITIDEVLAGLKQGRLTEMFAVGTAAVVTAIGGLNWENQLQRVGDGKAGPVAQKLYDRLTGIHRSKGEDTFNWMRVVPPRAR